MTPTRPERTEPADTATAETREPTLPRAVPRTRITGPKREVTPAEQHAELESELGHRIALVA